MVFLIVRRLGHRQSLLKHRGLIIIHASHLWREMLITVLEDRNQATPQNANHPKPSLSSPDYIPMLSLTDANKATGTGGSL